MKYKTITVPLYGDKIVIIITTDLSKIADKYKLELNGKEDAIVFDIGHRIYGVAFMSYNHGIIAHEALHLVRFIYEGINANFSLENDEHQCILLEWIVNEIYKVLE